MMVRYSRAFWRGWRRLAAAPGATVVHSLDEALSAAAADESVSEPDVDG